MNNRRLIALLVLPVALAAQEPAKAAAVERPDLVGECAVKIGSANLVLAIDARKATLPVPIPRSEATFPRSEAQPSGDLMRWEVFTHGGRRPTGLDAVEWAPRGECPRSTLQSDAPPIGAWSD